MKTSARKRTIKQVQGWCNTPGHTQKTNSPGWVTRKCLAGVHKRPQHSGKSLARNTGEAAAKVKMVFNFSCFIENTGDAAIHTRTTYENTLSWKVIYHTKGPQQVLNDPKTSNFAFYPWVLTFISFWAKTEQSQC